MTSSFLKNHSGPLLLTAQLLEIGATQFAGTRASKRSHQKKNRPIFEASKVRNPKSKSSRKVIFGSAIGWIRLGSEFRICRRWGGRREASFDRWAPIKKRRGGGRRGTRQVSDWKRGGNVPLSVASALSALTDNKRRHVHQRPRPIRDAVAVHHRRQDRRDLWTRQLARKSSRDSGRVRSFSFIVGRALECACSVNGWWIGSCRQPFQWTFPRWLGSRWASVGNSLSRFQSVSWGVFSRFREKKKWWIFCKWKKNSPVFSHLVDCFFFSNPR